MLDILPPAAERAHARRTVHNLIHELRAPAWQKGRPDQVASMDLFILQAIREWRRQHTATFRWVR